MTNTMTIKKAVQLASSPEVLEAQTIEVLEQVVATITASQDKKAHRKLDIVKAVLNNKKKTGADTEKIEQIENSIKVKKPTAIKPNIKAKQQAEKKAEQATLPLEENNSKLEEGKKLLAENITKAEKMADLRAIAKFLQVTVKVGTSTEKLRTQLLEKVATLTDVPEEKKVEEAPQQEKPKGKVAPKKTEPKQPVVVETFPETIQDGKLTKIELADLQGAIIDTPYKVICLILENGQEVATSFLVTYANSEVVVLVDISVEVNSVVPFATTSFNNKGEVKMDGKYVPVAFYRPTK